MDEDSFIQAFEDVKKLSIFNGRDVTQELSKSQQKELRRHSKNGCDSRKTIKHR